MSALQSLGPTVLLASASTSFAGHGGQEKARHLFALWASVVRGLPTDLMASRFSMPLDGCFTDLPEGFGSPVFSFSTRQLRSLQNLPAQRAY